MNRDSWRFFALFMVCLFVAWITEQYVIVFTSGFSLFFIWQYRVFKELLLWLRKRKEHVPPSQPGIVDDICREIDYLRKRHNQRKSKLSGFLKQFQNATAAIPDAAIILGEHGEIEWANDKAYEYMGIKWPQDGGLRIVNLVRHPRLQRYLGSKDEGELNKGLQMASSIVPNLKLEYRISSYGETQKLLFVRDITTVHQIEQMRKDFIANASHELRTPLTVISGYLESFDDDNDQCPEEWLPRIKQMRHQASRMQRLIEDLLLLSTLESQSPNEHKEEIAVSKLLENIHQEALTLDGERQHIIYLETDPSLWLKGNQRDFYSAFSNLIFNSVRYTPDKSPIRIRWYQDSEGAHLEVIDSGPGIPPEHIPRLTERFYRTDLGRSKEQGGTGLGLAIVKHVLANHNGSLHIESKLNEGSNFRCDFPISSIVIKEKQDHKTLAAN
ncbi:MAG: two-component system phosphate regulon sensor histidine kinase PhoR [Gammaproteobacteria bacterium]|jgi:two-component system phosphate regulon sensor histidine kinase PhoR